MGTPGRCQLWSSWSPLPGSGYARFPCTALVSGMGATYPIMYWRYGADAPVTLQRVQSPRASCRGGRCSFGWMEPSRGRGASRGSARSLARSQSPSRGESPCEARQAGSAWRGRQPWRALARLGKARSLAASEERRGPWQAGPWYPGSHCADNQFYQKGIFQENP